MTARLFLTCGLPGAGKTTLAKQLASSHNAVRLTKDDWLWELGSTPWDQALGQRVEEQLISLAFALLEVDTNVVLDFGLWTRAERDRLRLTARERGHDRELRFVSAEVDELWERISRRNARPPWSQAPISRAHLDEWAEQFEPPTEDELALFDPPLDLG